MEELLREQAKSRLFREGQSLSANCSMDDVKPLDIDELMKAHEKIKKIGPIYRYALSCVVAYNKIKEMAHREREETQFNPVAHLGFNNTYFGIDIRPLEGLEDKMLLFQNFETMDEFLRVVDVNKTINLFSQKRAVEEAIKHFEFVGRIKDGEMKVSSEDLKDEKIR